MINFGAISEPLHNFLDSDYIDIYRKSADSAKREEIYSNISCHIAINTADNPNPNSVDTKPIITSLVIHMPTWVDIKNDDYVIAKKMNISGEILALYSGTVGYPAVSMARQSVNMNMETLEVTEPITPVPPQNKSQVIISYLNVDNDEKIKSDLIQTVEQGVTVNFFPPNINNYELNKSVLDGQEMPLGAITIEDPTAEGHEIQFLYKAVSIISSFRVLVNGPYTKDNGTLGSGYHLYSKIPILAVSENLINIPVNKFIHDEIGIINITEGTKIKDNLGNWHIIKTNPQKIDDYYMCEIADYEPKEAEQNAYETHWYETRSGGQE